MMFLGIVRGDMQNIIKIGSKFGPPGSKNGYLSHFPPFLQFYLLFSETVLKQLRNGAKNSSETTLKIPQKRR